MHLKELTVLGYKSFATKHRFVFPPGVTAIVGPNGSGKSNIADAVRWVLGEQRTTSLRARRTEEMIFAGTEKRARGGMAEVSLRLDNSDGWIDVDFAEVEITRRAHRDGSSEYMINGAKVRLRDVLDALGAGLGASTYTVIGQGLVDSALALRPDERRALIDEAAGILPLQRRRDRALRQLDETGVNLTRVKDILAELTPRLRRMERIADRAERFEILSARLGRLLAGWYGHHWHTALAEWRDARAAEATAAATLATTEQRLGELRQLVEQAEAELEVAVARAGALRAERSRLAELAAKAHEASAVAAERREGLLLRLGERRSALEAASRTSAEIQAAAAESAEAMVEARAKQAAADEHLSSLEALVEAAAAAERQVADAREATLRDAIRADAAVAATEAALAQTVEAIERLAAGKAAAAGAAAALAARLEAGRRDTEKLAAAVDAVDAAHSVAASDLEALRAAVDQARADQREAAAGADAKAAELARRQTRLAALEEAAAGFGESSEAFTRTQSAVAAALVGTVSRLLVIDDGWEAAVAAVLGPRLHALVVADTTVLEAAVADLGPTPNGQVALVPAAAGGDRQPPAEVTSPALPGLARALLGDVAFAAGLADARRTLAADARVRLVATRDGRLLDRAGVVIAGAPGVHALAVAAELRRLPGAVEEATAQLATAQSLVDAAATGLEAAESAALAGVKRLEELEARRRAAQAEADAALSATDKIARDLEWQRESIARLEAEEQGLVARRLELTAQLESQTTAAAEASLGAATAADQRAAEPGPPETELAGARDAAAAARTKVAVLEAALSQAEAGRAEATARMADLEAGVVALEAELKALDSDLARAAGRALELAESLAALDVELTPAEAAQREAASNLRSAATALEAERVSASAIESGLAERRVATGRAANRLEQVYGRLLGDADWVPEAAGLTLILDLEAPPSLMPPGPPPTAEDEAAIAELRRDLRSMGGVDREALAAYTETAERHAHLTRERADLEAASADLRTVLDELEGEMAGLFERTFEAVAAEFAAFFPRLFGGGDARLVADKEQGGIEIIARPPGKRSQPLALLSGGERSLTAVALIFALLKASRAPFVVLDEVDAALDEANIDRFRSALAALAEETQVIIVTHNRGTVQTADTIYGVSMGDDGASRVVSLRVEELAAST